MSEFTSTKKLRNDWGVSKSYMSALIKDFKKSGGAYIQDGRITLVREIDVAQFMERRQDDKS